MASSQINCENSTTLCISFEGGMCLNPYIIKQRIRINLLKEEILRNLPKVKTNASDLYIHIRSGDIFSDSINPSYSQPPLCFYQEILNQFKFNNIYIISINKKNPVIEKLIKKNRKIKYSRQRGSGKATSIARLVGERDSRFVEVGGFCGIFSNAMLIA